MSEEPVEQHLTALIPENLDEIVRANRDKFRLAFATEDELKSLERDIPSGGPVRHTLEGWNVLMMHATAGGKTRSVPKLLGSVEETGQCWITSTIKGIDLDTGLVQTENSLYRVVGTQSFEPSVHLLLHVCVFLNQCGAGRYLGIPEFFYQTAGRSFGRQRKQFSMDQVNRSPFLDSSSRLKYCFSNSTGDSRFAIDGTKVLHGMPHPSPANSERIHYMLGQKPRSALSAKIDPDRLDAARAALEGKVARLLG